MTLRVYRKEHDDFSLELLGEYLNLLAISRTDPQGDIVTDAMVYFIQDDGSIGTANRLDVIDKDDKNPYYQSKPIDETDIAEEIDLIDEPEI